MPITPCAAERAPAVSGWRSLEALPEDAAALFAPPLRERVFASRPWYRAVVEAAIPTGAEPCLLVCSAASGPVALLPMLRQGRSLGSLTTPYTALYRPLAATDDAAALQVAGRAFGRFCRAWSCVRLDALDPGWPGLAPFLAGLGEAGLRAERFAQFGNWQARTAGLDWAGYLRARPGALREVVRRKTARFWREDGADFELVAGPDGLAVAMAAYEAVYARSWKRPEPFPRFVPTWMGEAAAAGILRLGLLRLGGRPVAAQLWIASGGWASVMKLAHDEAFAPLSPGTVLTALMIRSLIEREAVDTLDFGRGDDPYKQLWAERREPRIGLLLINPRRPAGAAALARQTLGRLLRRAGDQGRRDFAAISAERPVSLARKSSSTAR